MSDPLAEREFVPCAAGTPPLGASEREALLAELDGWTVVDGHHLAKEYRFHDFVSALAFVNRVGALSEAVNHHPDLHLRWGRVAVEVWTHTIDGLAVSDFVWAAKCDQALGA